MEAKEAKIEPSVLFTSLVMSLASSATVELGLVEDPETKQKRTRPEIAKQSIDLLEMLQTKTRGNLSSDEIALMSHVLTDLKFQFAKIVK